MTSEERVMSALRKEPVDRVPTFEWLISKKLINAIIPGASEADFIEQMDIDGITVSVNYDRDFLDDVTYRDEWGIIRKITAEEQDMPVSGPVSSLEDLMAYTLPDPNSPHRLLSLQKALDRFQGHRAIILHLNDVFSLPSRIMPFDEFIMATADERELVSKLISVTVDYNIALAQRAWNMGLRIVMTGDDYCYSAGPLVSPACFRELFHPYYQKVMTAYKDIGFLVIKHCDGNVLPIIDMIMDAPIDCYDPIDPSAGLSLAYFKKTFGSRICLKGNIDCAQTLTFESVDSVVAQTKEALQIGMPGYGYILSSSNSLHSKVKPENYIAMIDTLHQFGVYR